MVRSVSLPVLVVITGSVISLVAWLLVLVLPFGANHPFLLLAAGTWLALAAGTGSCLLTEISNGVVHSLEQSRELKSQLNEAEARIAKFMARFSHEFRTPLHAILGYTDLLLDDEDILDRPHLTSDVERIRVAGMSLHTLVNDLMAIGSKESKEVHVEPISIGQLISDISEIMEPTLQRHQNELIVRGTEDPTRVLVDTIKVEHILMALLNSATRLTDRAIQLDLSIQQHHESWLLIISLSDTDSAGDVATMFQPFAEDGRQGSGLGLAACKQLVDDLGGDITVETTDQGTTITVQLPTELAEETAADASAPAAGCSVLVIDENDDSANLLLRHLKQIGCDVTVMNDAAAGKKIAIHLQPDLIVLDMENQSLSSWAILQHLKFDSLTRTIPIIVCSSVDARARAVEAGAAHVLVKPIALDSLADVISGLGAATSQQAPGGGVCVPVPAKLVQGA